MLIHFGSTYLSINMDYGASSDIERKSYRWYIPLLAACATGNLCIVKALLRNKADVNKCNYMKELPLFVAVEQGCCDIVKDLVAHNADVNLTSKYNQSPLYSAAERGHYDIVLFLLQNGADVNICNFGNESPLYVASSYGHCDIVRLLIAHGALSAGNTKSQVKTISKRNKDYEIFSYSNALLNPCGYPEEKISHSKEKQEEEKEGIYELKHKVT